mgnify:CR=1 FL=1
MTPIHLCSREERLSRALFVLECLAMTHMDLGPPPEDGEPEGLAELVYEIAHSATGRCCNGGRQTAEGGWLRKVEELEREMLESHIGDPEEALKRTPKY